MGEHYIFNIAHLTKHYGKKEVLKDIRLAFYPGAKIGVIGSNGSGKSTLLQIMAGEDKDFMGEAWAEKGATIGFVPQEPHLTPGKTVLENIEEAVAPIRGLLKQAGGDRRGDGRAGRRLREALRRDGAGCRRRSTRPTPTNLDRQLEIAMDAMRLPPPDAPVEQLSGGERRRVALCKTLLQRHDLLLLDEPTNHLDAESVEWLEHHLAEYPGTVVAVTHDRYFLDNVAKWILELDRGRGYPYQGQLLRLAGAEASSGWRSQEKQESARQKAARTRTGMGEDGRRARGSPRARPASRPSTSSRSRRSTRRRRSWRSRSRPARRSATSSSGPRASRRATATTCCSRT